MIRDALGQLAALSVAGVANVGVASVPDVLARAHLPALLVLPGAPQDNSLFKDYGEGFRAIAFSDGARSLSVTVTHLLLVMPVGANTGARGIVPALIDHVDGYIAALSADVTLGGTLAAPAQVTINVGTFDYGGVTYHGCAFQHTWTMEITP